MQHDRSPSGCIEAANCNQERWLGFDVLFGETPRSSVSIEMDDLEMPLVPHAQQLQLVRNLITVPTT